MYKEKEIVIWSGGGLMHIVKEGGGEILRTMKVKRKNKGIRTGDRHFKI